MDPTKRRIGLVFVLAWVNAGTLLDASGQCPPDLIARQAAELRVYQQQRNAMEPQATRFDEWGIVEVMGRARFAGRISEEVVAGAGFIRVDVPAVGDRPAFSKLLAPAALYSITPTSEEVARGVAANDRKAPLEPYDLPAEWREQMRLGRAVISSNPDVDDPGISDDGSDDDAWEDDGDDNE